MTPPFCGCLPASLVAMLESAVICRVSTSAGGVEPVTELSLSPCFPSELLSLEPRVVRLNYVWHDDGQIESGEAMGVSE